MALSSTAIVLKLLGDRGEANTTPGQIGLGLLIFQDLAVIVMVLLVPMLGGGGGTPADLAAALGKALLLIAAVLVVARRLMPRVLEVVARTCSPELFLLTVIALCFGTAFLTSLAGVSVSLGAFLAGLLVSESRFSQHAFGEILPLQILFSAVFFISVGMLLDVGFLAANLPLVLAVVAGVLVLKVLTTGASVLALGYGLPAAALAGLLLAGPAARRLVRVLAGSRIPFLVTTLSPAGAEEAEAEGLPVLRGDLGKAHLLALAGTERAKMLVVADDPATAHRITAVARSLNPTLRIVVRTRFLAEVEALTAAGADRVVSEELESIVQLFADVLRDYRVAPAEIEAHVEAMRGRGYAALREAPAPGGEPVVVCDGLGPDCLNTRTVVLRPAAPAAGRSLGDLAEAAAAGGFRLAGVRRNGAVLLEPAPDLTLRPYDELTLEGSPDALARAAPLFRTGAGDGLAAGVPAAPAAFCTPASDAIDLERTVRFVPGAGEETCSHLAQIRPVLPGAHGCEECLATGDAWVHLRICLTCGHVGCCDASPNRHARAHHHATGHPVIRSMEPGEAWAWCYPDETML